MKLSYARLVGEFSGTLQSLLLNYKLSDDVRNHFEDKLKELESISDDEVFEKDNPNINNVVDEKSLNIPQDIKNEIKEVNEGARVDNSKLHIRYDKSAVEILEKYSDSRYSVPMPFNYDMLFAAMEEYKNLSSPINVEPEITSQKIKNKIVEEANWRSTNGHGGVDDITRDNFIQAAEFGYSLSLSAPKVNVEEAAEVIKQSLKLIKQWHNMQSFLARRPENEISEMWNIYYNNAPEMKIIREYFKK